MLEEEHNLIARSVKGDGEAFGILYDHYHPRIYRFVYLKVGRREEAEDLAHQVFLHAWERFPSYTDRGYPLGSWLYRIARNAVIDHYRTRREAVPIEDLDPELFTDGSDIESAAEEGLTLSDVRAALTALKPAHQDIIILRFVDELSLKEAAEALGKSEGAAKLLQHRATRELKKRLDAKSPKPERHGRISPPKTAE